ncbi:MAG TPA: Gfo/Idh/MocA family oxidoreductase [Trebonia sp.]|nr:Gfo/Idh/MocA family oxidoreductase [Trebonia sp.]
MTPLRALLVGAGGMGKAWARALTASPEAVLAGWVDLFRERAVSAGTELGLRDVMFDDDLASALGRVNPDFVVDVAVPEAHAEVTLACLERQIPVLGEKPMAATMDEARTLVAASERTGTLFAVSQNRRYNKGLAALRALVGTELGGAGQVSAEFYKGPHFGGFRDEMDSPLLVDMAIHTFDAARYLAGADPVSVFCTEHNPSWSWYRGAASAVAEFEFTNGVRFTYQGSWCAQGLDTSWDSSWRVLGPKGSVTWDGYDSLVAEMAEAGRREVAPPPIPAEGIDGSLADFIRALRGGEPPMSECHDNIRSLAMVMAALESSRAQRRVRVDW